jgi:hypothetical protein
LRIEIRITPQIFKRPVFGTRINNLMKNKSKNLTELSL